MSKELEELIGELVRDITKVGFMSKSEAKRRLEEMYQAGKAAERQRIEKENMVWKATVASNYEQKLTVEKANALLAERQRIREVAETLKRDIKSSGWEDTKRINLAYNQALSDILNSLTGEEAEE